MLKQMQSTFLGMVKTGDAHLEALHGQVLFQMFVNLSKGQEKCSDALVLLLEKDECELV